VIRGTRILSRAAGPLAVAVLGGGIALGGAALFGAFDGDTTLVREVALAPTRSAATPPAAVAPGGLSINAIYERAKSGVVQINSTRVTESYDFFGFPEEERRQALGSGFVIDKAGYIVTNYHVVEDADEISVSFSNRDRVKAEIVGTDPSTDVAVLKVEAKSRALTPLALGDSDSVKVGDPVVAIGNPFGLERSVTAGIVSAVQRQIAAPNRLEIDKVIQTDAAINSGNSGGPLLNARGEVVGVNTAIATGSDFEQGNVGIGFAVPVNTVSNVAAQLIENGEVQRAFLGVTVQPFDERLSGLVDLPVQRGLLVQRVDAGSAAAKAGLRAGSTPVVVAGESYVLGGDVIVALDGKSCGTFEQLRDVILERKPGDRVEIEFYRGADRRTLEVKLGRQPSSPG
jgi:S1-C subfamily serine protease